MLKPPNKVLPDQFDPDPRLQTLLDRITTYYPRAIDPNLSRTEHLLSVLGNPHLSLPPFFHVGGTNGKGSITAYLRAVIEAVGQTCHVMTSPHLVHFNERIVVAGHEIETSDLIDLIEEVEAKNANAPTTSFEMITAAGFLAFSRKPADFCVIEVGMGGRFDATNVIPAPLASVISVISRDHVKFLGSALCGIALEKAGIMKSGAPCIIGPQTREGLNAGVMGVFEDVAVEQGCPLYRHGFEWSFDVLPDRLLLHIETNIFELPKPNLLGEHQFANAATAAMALLTVQDKAPLPLSAFEYGLTHAKWPGRLQRIVQGPLIEHLPSHIEVWIDGGHNDSCGMALETQLKNWRADDGKPLHLVLGMLNTKNPKEFADFLMPYAESVQAITIPEQHLSLSNEELASQIGAKAVDSLDDAVRHVAATERSPARILITGSLYLMGRILAEHS